jgi:phosphoglycolate phosphatase-like HAD superfamily hydrolase
MIRRGWLITTLCCSTSTAFSSTRACHSRAASTARSPRKVCPEAGARTPLHLGPPLHRTFQAPVSEQSLVQAYVDSYCARYSKLAASETTVFHGIREILDSISDQLPLVIATSKPRALAEPLLESLDLRRFFTAVIGPELDSENEQKAVTIE